ncbi:MAG: hypothetical protein ACXWLR_08065 [Myxococcales bacterium]
MIRTIAAALAAFVLVAFSAVAAEETKPADSTAKPEKKTAKKSKKAKKAKKAPAADASSTTTPPAK